MSGSVNIEQDGTMTSLEPAPLYPVKPLIDEPRITATIDTGYETLYSVRCLSEEVWTCGGNNIIKRFDLQGKLLTSIKTESWIIPGDIVETKNGDLIYIGTRNKTINLVKNKQIQTVITLQGWVPLYVCNTESDDILVTMLSDDRKQCKVVRYSDFTENQTIQFDDKNCPLYSSVDSEKYISENRNLDICVADRGANALVVVNQSGKLRFKYTGHPSNTGDSFHPVGITTDSQSHILTADINNNCIHILDQDGHFLRYIQNCHLHCPEGLCVDIRDNIFVGEWDTAKVKKIQYLQEQC